MNQPSPIVLDYRGLRCPLPVIRARKALRKLPAGQEALISADDPSAREDFRAFCDLTGHELLAITEQENTLEFRIRTRSKGI